MKVNLTYFKQSGKFYTSQAGFEVDCQLFHEACKLLRDLFNSGKFPGLVDGADEFIVHADIFAWNDGSVPAVFLPGVHFNSTRPMRLQDAEM